MMNKYTLSILALAMLACNAQQNKNPQIEGTWKLYSATLIQNSDTSYTEYSKQRSFIKIINKSHFAFLSHDLQHGADSSMAMYTSGGGKYQLVGNKYTEHLEYCSDRAWEAHDFEFTVTIHNNTLIQQGIEKVPEKGIERLNIERYVRVL
jgi:hypothetical protein